jgi:AraC family transcriptional regulator
MSSSLSTPTAPADARVLFHESTNKIRVSLLTDPPGIFEFAGSDKTIVSIHVGQSVHMTCRHGTISHTGTAIHGDIDIIPAGMPASWEMKRRDMALVVSLSPELVSMAAEELDADPAHVEIRNTFKARDPRIEQLAWALKEEMESGYQGGPFYLDSLAREMAAQVVSRHSSLQIAGNSNAGISSRKLKQLLSYIEDNLGADLSLHEIADVAGLSVSHCKVLFRRAVGIPIHQYVIRRRVDRAAALLRESKMAVSEIALATGFTHQSHLAAHIRRVLGVSPKELRAGG